MNDIAQQTLAKRRAGLKSDLTIHENRLLDFQIDSQRDYFEVVNRLEQIQGVYCKFAEVQAELDLFELDFTEKEQFTQRYFTLRAHCEFLLRNSGFDPVQPPPSLVNGTNGFRGFPSPE